MQTLIRGIIALNFLLGLVTLGHAFAASLSVSEEIPISVTAPPTVAPESFVEHCEKTPPEGLDALIHDASKEFGISPRLLAITIYRESQCWEKALGSSGEIGLSQVLPGVWGGTLKEEGIIHRIKDLWHPKTNLRAAAYILSVVSDAANGDLYSIFRRYNGSGSKARRYAQEQLNTYRSLWSTPDV